MAHIYHRVFGRRVWVPGGPTDRPARSRFFVGQWKFFTVVRTAKRGRNRWPLIIAELTLMKVWTDVALPLVHGDDDMAIRPAIGRGGY